MRQAVMIAPGKIEFREVADLTNVANNEVLLNIKRNGVCGSDIQVNHDRHPFTKYPIVQGHEYSGLVIKTGKDVTRVKPGIKATARPQLVCGTCASCIRGEYNVCQNFKVEGFQANGCAQDYSVVAGIRKYGIAEAIRKSDQLAG